MPAHSINLDARLIESRLVTADELARVRAAAGGTPDDAQLLDLLVRCDLLTKWQAAQLQAGKWKGFVLDHYRLLDPLGAGGMGQVFRALDAKTGRHVAVKLLPKRLATRDAIERFRREGQAAPQVQHEHIVRCYELGQHGETHYLVMELVEGTTLAKFIQKNWLLSTKETARIGREVALALEHARQRGVVHRDIKPSNIMLTKKGSVKLADLGLAKFFDDRADQPASLTHTGAFMGTVDYCAPEQAEDAKRADTRSDIYSLGCTLYECLTGRVPFASGTSVQKIVAHREQEAAPVHEVNTEVPEFFSVLIAKRMLAKRPEDRFQSPAEAADALEPWAKGEGRSIDAAQLAHLIDDEFQAEPVQPSRSTHRERPETILPASRRRRSSSRGFAASALAAILRGLFVHRLSWTFVRLGVLVAVFIGLGMLYRAGGRGGLRAIFEGPPESGESQSESVAGAAPVKPTLPSAVPRPAAPRAIMPTGASGMTMPGVKPTSTDAAPATPNVAAPTPTLQQRSKLVLWLRADAGVTFDAQDRVSFCIDQSGDGHRASQSKPIHQPLFVRSVLNGRPIIRFDGNDSLDLAGRVLSSQQFSIFAVVNERATDTGYRVVFSNWRGNPNSVFISTLRQNPRRARFTDELGGYYHNDNSGVGTITEPASHFILTGIASTSDALIYQNETLIAQRGSPLSQRDLFPPYMIGTQGPGGEFWLGDLAELLVYDAELSLPDRRGVWAYLAEKYLRR